MTNRNFVPRRDKAVKDVRELLDIAEKSNGYINKTIALIDIYEAVLEYFDVLHHIPSFMNTVVTQCKCNLKEIDGHDYENYENLRDRAIDLLDKAMAQCMPYTT